MSLREQIINILEDKDYWTESSIGVIKVDALLALIKSEKTKTVKEFAVFILNNVNTSTAGIMTSFEILIDKFLNTKTDKLPEGE